MITINKRIQECLRQAVEENGSVLQLARRMGVMHTTVRNWLSGDTRRINETSWERLVHFLKPYLSGEEYEAFLAPVRRLDRGAGTTVTTAPPAVPNTIRNTPELRECIKDAMLRRGVRDAGELRRLIGYDSTHSLERLLNGKLNWFPDILSAVFDVLEIPHDDAPISPGERMLLAPAGIFNDGGMLIRPIPVVDWANAADYIDSLVVGGGTVLRRWDPESTEVVPAPIGVRRGAVSLRIHGQSMEPKLLDGDKIICEPVEGFDEIPNNKVVVAKFSDTYEKCSNCLVCKRLRRIAGTVCLVSDNPAGRTFDDVHPSDVTWVGVVVGKYSNEI